ncbi:MAG: hypothetical protein JOZ55_10170 [Alphaproteobacteria bacterium]|nr:hypothetical protein [Alphaproteobacteria bacterium]
MHFLVFGSGLALLILGGLALLQGVVFGRAFLPGPLFEAALTISASVPLLAVVLVAEQRGDPTLVLSSVIGANIVVVLAGTGLLALIAPLAAPTRTILRDGVSLFAAAVALSLMSWGGGIGRIDGVLLLLGFVALLFLLASQQPALAASGVRAADRRSRPFIAGLLIPAGMAGVTSGAILVGDSWQGAAALFHLDGIVTGFSILAPACALPLLLRSFIDARQYRNETELGPLLRFGLFNSLAIAGVVALWTGLAVPPGFAAFEIPVFVVASAIIPPLALPRREISRLGGAGLVILYLVVIGVFCSRHGLFAQFVPPR